MNSKVPSTCLVKHTLPLGLHGSTKVVLVCRKTPLHRWGAESITRLLCPVTELFFLGCSFRGWQKSTVSSEHSKDLCLSSLRMNRGIRELDLIQTSNQSKLFTVFELSFCFFFFFFLVSSYWVKLMTPFRLWVSLEEEESFGGGGQGMNVDLNICWLSCWRWRKAF